MQFSQLTVVSQALVPVNGRMSRLLDRISKGSKYHPSPQIDPKVRTEYSLQGTEIYCRSLNNYLMVPHSGCRCRIKYTSNTPQNNVGNYASLYPTGSGHVKPTLPSSKPSHPMLLKVFGALGHFDMEIRLAFGAAGISQEKLSARLRRAAAGHGVPGLTSGLRGRYPESVYPKGSQQLRSRVPKDHIDGRILHSRSRQVGLQKNEGLSSLLACSSYPGLAGVTMAQAPKS